jgi:hypothetical protein
MKSAGCEANRDEPKSLQRQDLPALNPQNNEPKNRPEDATYANLAAQGAIATVSHRRQQRRTK